MKVKDLLRVTHLFDGQNVVIKDVQTKDIFKSHNRYDFDPSVEDHVLSLRVNSFTISDSTILIHAQTPNTRSK